MHEMMQLHTMLTCLIDGSFRFGVRNTTDCLCRLGRPASETGPDSRLRTLSTNCPFHFVHDEAMGEPLGFCTGADGKGDGDMLACTVDRFHEPGRWDYSPSRVG